MKFRLLSRFLQPERLVPNSGKLVENGSANPSDPPETQKHDRPNGTSLVGNPRPPCPLTKNSPPARGDLAASAPASRRIGSYTLSRSSEQIPSAVREGKVRCSVD